MHTLQAFDLLFTVRRKVERKSEETNRKFTTNIKKQEVSKGRSTQGAKAFMERERIFWAKEM